MRLLVVSNRLPITIVEKEGRLRFKESVGGLVCKRTYNLHNYGEAQKLIEEMVK